MSTERYLNHDDGRNDTQANVNSECTFTLGSNFRLGEFMAQLPDEVLSEIFSWCCPMFNDRFCASPISALIVSHVCKRWRKIAFSTPKLWTYTSLGAPRHHCESVTELMLLWINNSKTCPLVIDVDFSKFAAFKAPDAVLPAVLELTMLASALKRPPGPDDMALTVSAQPSISIPFPYVEEEYYWTNDDNDLPKSFASNSMQLRVATKPCILLGMDGHRNFGPYLVHLDLRDEDEAICLTMEEALDIIKAYPKLRYLSFRLGYAGEGGETCMLPNLKTLAVSWCEDIDPAPFLDALSAPALQNLELDGQMPTVFVAGPQWVPLRQFLLRSAPPLRTLDLYKIRCDAVDLLGCVGRCTSLERLWLEDCSVGKDLVNDFLEARHPLVEAVQSTLANLKTLGLVRCAIFDAQRFFKTLIVSGLVWRITALDGLYLSECNVNEGVSETWHLLRSRYVNGAYENLERVP